LALQVATEKRERLSVKQFASNAFHGLRIGMASLALFQFVVGTTLNAAPIPQSSGSANSDLAIQHVIVIIGENRSFDHVFATYQPRRGQTVWNLLSEGIINADGTPGPNFSQAAQRASADQAPDTFLLSPPKTSFPNQVLPAPLVGGPADSYVPGDSLTLAQQSENGLPTGYYPYLISGGTGLKSQTPDTRIMGQFVAARPVSIDERHQFSLQLLFGKSGPSFLPDVATDGLQRGSRQL
jgi:phospholipase C